MTPFPTPYEVETEAYQPQALDALNNPVESWADPITQKVIGWAAVSTDPKLVGHDRIVVDMELAAPPEFVIGPNDRVTINGKKFYVIGYPEDTDGNPYLWHPGMVVNLKRIEG